MYDTTYGHTMDQPWYDYHGRTILLTVMIFSNIGLRVYRHTGRQLYNSENWKEPWYNHVVTMIVSRWYTHGNWTTVESLYEGYFCIMLYWVFTSFVIIIHQSMLCWMIPFVRIGIDFGQILFLFLPYLCLS